MKDRDWMPLINKRAAVKEQFPSLAKVLAERPGSPRDRELREFYHADNRRSWARSQRTARVRVEQERADAERFIEMQRERELSAYAAKWHDQHGTKRRTA